MAGREPENCTKIAQQIMSRTNMADGTAQLFQKYGPSMPQTAQEAELIAKLKTQPGTSPECADIAATAIIDTARMKQLATMACQQASPDLINQIGPQLVERASAWKPKVDAVCKKPTTL